MSSSQKSRIHHRVAPVVHRFADEEEVADAVARHLVESIEQSIAARGSCRVGLAGGSTPRRSYRRLAMPDLAGRIDWQRVHLFWGDERCVAPDDENSNYKMVRTALLDSITIPDSNVHRVRGELPPAEAADHYERELGDEPLDVLLLGMGGDGHTASLFPDGPELRASDRNVVASRGPVDPVDRVTLTLKGINHARNVVFVVTGTAKSVQLAEIIQQMTTGAEPLPAARVQPESGSLHIFADQAAATKLEG